MRFSNSRKQSLTRGQKVEKSELVRVVCSFVLLLIGIAALKFELPHSGEIVSTAVGILALRLSGHALG
jgi:hypothetical protein